MKSLKKRASAKLKELRLKFKTAAGPNWRQWTQGEVAERLGEDLINYQRWEDGKAWPKDFEKLKRLADEFKVEIGFFAEDERETKHSETTISPALARKGFEAWMQTILAEKPELESLFEKEEEQSNELGQLNEFEVFAIKKMRGNPAYYLFVKLAMTGDLNVLDEVDNYDWDALKKKDLKQTLLEVSQKIQGKYEPARLTKKR